MSKRPNLAEVVEAAGSTRRQPPPESVTASEDQPPEGAALRPRTRVGRKQIAGHFPPEVAWQLRELAVKKRTTVQNLLGEALNDLFQKYGKPEIAPMEEGRA